MKKLILGDNIHREMSDMEVMSAALLGGSLASLYVSPAELIMIQQQNFGGTLAQVRRILSLFRAFFVVSTKYFLDARPCGETERPFWPLPRIHGSCIERWVMDSVAVWFYAHHTRDD